MVKDEDGGCLAAGSLCMQYISWLNRNAVSKAQAVERSKIVNKFITIVQRNARITDNT